MRYERASISVEGYLLATCAYRDGRRENKVSSGQRRYEGNKETIIRVAQGAQKTPDITDATLQNRTGDAKGRSL